MTVVVEQGHLDVFNKTVSIQLQNDSLLEEMCPPSAIILSTLWNNSTMVLFHVFDQSLTVECYTKKAYQHAGTPMWKEHTSSQNTHKREKRHNLLLNWQHAGSIGITGLVASLPWFGIGHFTGLSLLYEITLWAIFSTGKHANKLIWQKGNTLDVKLIDPLTGQSREMDLNHRLAEY